MSSSSQLPHMTGLAIRSRAMLRLIPQNTLPPSKPLSSPDPDPDPDFDPNSPRLAKPGTIDRASQGSRPTSLTTNTWRTTNRLQKRRNRRRRNNAAIAWSRLGAVGNQAGDEAQRRPEEPLRNIVAPVAVNAPTHVKDAPTAVPQLIQGSTTELEHRCELMKQRLPPVVMHPGRNHPTFEELRAAGVHIWDLGRKEM